MRHLTETQAKELMDQILTGKKSTSELVQLFTEIEKMGGINLDELKGFLESARQYSLQINSVDGAVDTCGTGGDGFSTFNISTTSSFVVAAAGIPVAKHGNRAASSKCGSADVLEELGINLELSVKEAEDMLKQTGFVFLFARKYNPAFRFVAEARAEYGKRTFFNIIGPLLSPAHVKYQLVGVSDESYAEMIGQALVDSGSEKVLIVHGEEGLDEISISGDTVIYDFTDGAEMKKSIINPRDFGLDTYDISMLKGGSSKANAEILRQVLANKATPAQMNAILLNAGASIYVAGKTETITQGIEIAKDVIKTGKALAKLDEVISYAK